MLHRLLWLCVIFFIGHGVSSDVPFVFDSKISYFANYTSAQLEQASIESSDLAGVPAISMPLDNEVLIFPITGGGVAPEGTQETNVDKLRNIFNSRIEPDNVTVHYKAVALAGRYSGDYTIEQVSEIYSILQDGWHYVRDPRGIDFLNYASESIMLGKDVNGEGAGDCDDFAILMSALIESIGGTTRIILAYNNSSIGHAYAEVYIGKLNSKDSQVDNIINWLKHKYSIDKVYVHIDTNTRDVWLNLDWWPDQNESPHPGGLFFQGDKSIVLYIRDKYKKIPLNLPEKINKLPNLLSELEIAPHSETITGKGSIKKDYYIMNKANDFAKVSLNIENASYYKYKYNIYSNEKQCIADLDLLVERAEQVICSGNAKNRNNIPTNMTTSIRNGNFTFLIYNSTMLASDQGVQSSQNIEFDSKGDDIYANGAAQLNDNTKNIVLKNNISATTCEHFQGTQKISIGEDVITHARINAITGPLMLSSSIWEGDQKINATANVDAGVVYINQVINPSEAYQDSRGVIGGAVFNIGILGINTKNERAYTIVGSGNLVTLSQLASAENVSYKVNYEFMPVSYQTGEYSINQNASRIEPWIDQSIQALEKAEEINQYLAYSWYSQGTALYDQGYYDEAMQDIEKAIKLDSKYAPSWYGKGWILYQQHKYNESIQAFDKTIELDPNNPNIGNAWHGKALSLLALGSINEGDAAMAKAKELGYNE